MDELVSKVLDWMNKNPNQNVLIHVKSSFEQTWYEDQFRAANANLAYIFYAVL